MTKIIVLSGGLGYTQFPLIGFHEQYANGESTSIINDVLSEYNSIGVEFGVNWGAGGENQSSIDSQSGRFSGNGSLVHMANYFKGTNHNPATNLSNLAIKMNYKWLSFDVKSNVTKGPIIHGGSNLQIPKTLDENLYYFRASPIDGTLLNTVLSDGTILTHSYTKTLLNTISENGGPNFLDSNGRLKRQPTYNELRQPLIKCLMDNMKFLEDQASGGTNKPQILHWWNSTIMPSPLYTTYWVKFIGWYRNPAEFDSNNNMISGTKNSNKRIFSRKLITGENVYVLNENSDGKYLELSSDDWNEDYENRATESLYDKCINSKPLSLNPCKIMVHQLYSPIYSRSLQEIVGNDVSMNTDIDDLIMAGEPNLFQERSKVVNAVYKTARENWIVNWKTFGNKASMGFELCMDKTVPDNMHWGLATTHEDFKNYFIRPMFDPITQEESIKHDLPIGLIMIPKQIALWTATGYYLGGVFGSGNENNTDFYACYSWVRNYARSNILYRFPVPSGMSLEWIRGSDYHGHVCEKLEEFGIDRCKAIKQVIDENKYKGISTESKISILKQKIQDFMKEND